MEMRARIPMYVFLNISFHSDSFVYLTGLVTTFLFIPVIQIFDHRSILINASHYLLNPSKLLLI